MKGYSYVEDPFDDPDDHEGSLPSWARLVVNAVGAVIEFWGFKRNQGKVWALLYLYDEPMDAAQIRDILGLSKGAASMILREIEGWGVIRRIKLPDSQSWHFCAELHLFKMIGKVFQEREVQLVRRVRDDLKEAERLARASGDVPQPMLDRLVKMHRLATLIEHALHVFLSTARLDVANIEGIFDEES